MKRIFTILAFTVLTAISSFGQSSYEYEVEYIYDEATCDSVEFMHIYGEIAIDTIEYVKPQEEPTVAPFEIENGMVYSRGIIKVYDIRGRLVAMRSQSFNVNSISSLACVYIIVAEEGVIKFNSAWVTYGAETREQMKGMPERLYKWNDFSNTWVIVTDDDK